MPTIHPTAIVHETADIGRDVCIGPFCIIGPQVIVGDECVLHDSVTLSNKVKIGKNNVLFPFSHLGADPIDRSQETSLGSGSMNIGNNNVIRERVCIHAGNSVGRETCIGDHVVIDARSQISSGCVIEDRVEVGCNVFIGDNARLKNRSMLQSNVFVHKLVTVGEHAFVTSMSRVVKDALPFMFLEGDPAIVKAVNLIGMNRGKYSQEEITALKVLTRKGKNNWMQAIPGVHEVHRSLPAVQLFTAAFNASRNGTHGRALEKREKK